MLDLESVRLFVLATDFGNLTRAAEAAGTVQPVVSQRLKALEAALGRRLLERTPRFVRPTPDGAAFLERARALLAAHDAAVRFTPTPAVRFAIGLSEHAIGVGLESVLRRVRAALPCGATVEVRTGQSQPLRAAFDAGEIDAVVIRREAGGSEGEVLGTDPLGWRAADGFRLCPGEPVPLATLAPPCGVRAAALRALERAGIAWQEAFLGGGCAALLAGARAGLGVAPMGRAASGDAPDAGPTLGLPPLPASEIVLFGRAGAPTSAAALRAVAAGLRAALLPR
ncbi:LysR family transcriptional regulator [Rhodovastum atsumiense]|uniref:LysR family transcriptional regulator n=1 Tax=Rhodovastum atsumiense TaxID=504468 RepID=A0A5M6IVN2_9PROT|nr:LysR family transcriptional regulator [Rhodovastum atsumiense]KAA5611907.1 LysR family transcriptional regulator [Rhodovastum atsumiense]